jgi:hypothetical protein
MSAQSSRVRVYDFPAGIGAPSEIGICSEDGPVLFWSKDSSQPNSSTLYRFDLCTQNLGALLKGTLGDIRCSPRPHILSVQLRNGDATTLVVLDDNGKETGELKYPESAAYFFPQWTTDGSRLVYEVDDPNKAPNDTLAFTAFGVLDVCTWTHSIFPIHQDAFGLDIVARTDKTLICISLHAAEAPAAWRFAIRDLNGERMQLPEARLRSYARRKTTVTMRRGRSNCLKASKSLARKPEKLSHRFLLSIGRPTSLWSPADGAQRTTICLLSDIEVIITSYRASWFLTWRI